MKTLRDVNSPFDTRPHCMSHDKPAIADDDSFFNEDDDEDEEDEDDDEAVGGENEGLSVINVNRRCLTFVSTELCELVHDNHTGGDKKLPSLLLNLPKGRPSEPNRLFF